MANPEILTLQGGVQVPTLGLGVYRNPGDGSAQRSVTWALEAGYRHLDTAAIYNNESDVGRALATSSLPRAQVFVTTKLWRGTASKQEAIDRANESLDKLGMDYVDLYLMHAPPDPPNRRSVWEGMEEVQASGKTRAIGVSNYGVHHLKELLDHCSINPVMNQLELSPYLQRAELVAFCRAHDIALTAYSPLTKGQRLNDSRLVALAKKYDRTPAQVLIRWGLEQGYVVIPKSSQKQRIIENGAVRDWTLEDSDLREISTWEEGLVTGWNPVDQP